MCFQHTHRDVLNALLLCKPIWEVDENEKIKYMFFYSTTHDNGTIVEYSRSG